MSLYSRRWFCGLSGSVRGRISNTPRGAHKGHDYWEDHVVGESRAVRREERPTALPFVALRQRLPLCRQHGLTLVGVGPGPSFCMTLLNFEGSRAPLASLFLSRTICGAAEAINTRSTKSSSPSGQWPLPLLTRVSTLVSPRYELRSRSS